MCCNGVGVWGSVGCQSFICIYTKNNFFMIFLPCFDEGFQVNDALGLWFWIDLFLLERNWLLTCQ